MAVTGVDHGQMPAYPVITSMGKHQAGVTIREYYAAMAMQGILAFGSSQPGNVDVAIKAVKCADALIAELAKPKP